MNAKIVLASASPQRRELLQQIGIDPLCVPADIDESRLPGESATAFVERLAVEKCGVIAEQYPQATVIGADTVISVGEQVLGKARDVDQAVETLTTLSDNQHTVLTGVAFVKGGVRESFVAETMVNFRAITEAEMVTYWNGGEPRGKAGCYAIQGVGAVFVKSLQGSYSNVVGLPLHEVAQQLNAFGYHLLDC